MRGNVFAITAILSLIAAAESDHSGMAKLLLEAGADVNIRDFKNKTAMMRALDKGHNDIAEMIRSVENKGAN